ncbi:MAG: hypothetical protein ABI310_05265 [Microbacteriaceae bacterium]
MPTLTPAQMHRDTSRLDPHELVRQLNAGLGPTLVAALAGASSRKQPYEWAKLDGPVPRAAAWNRLQFAHQVWHALSSEEGVDVARRWFIGGNPLLAETTPVMAIREDRHAAVRRAVQAFIDGDIDE